MKDTRVKTVVPILGALAVAALVFSSPGQVKNQPGNSQVEKAILNRLQEIQNAAQALDPEKVFSFVVENDRGALVQNGKLFLTRKEALDSTKQGFRGLQKVDYNFTQQHVTLLSPTVALVVGEGSSSAATLDGRTFSRPFAQSVVLVLTNGGWRVFHAHRSFPAN